MSRTIKSDRLDVRPSGSQILQIVGNVISLQRDIPALWIPQFVNRPGYLVKNLARMISHFAFVT